MATLAKVCADCAANPPNISPHAGRSGLNAIVYKARPRRDITRRASKSRADERYDLAPRVNTTIALPPSSHCGRVATNIRLHRRPTLHLQLCNQSAHARATPRQHPVATHGHADSRRGWALRPHRVLRGRPQGPRGRRGRTPEKRPQAPTGAERPPRSGGRTLSVEAAVPAHGFEPRFRDSKSLVLPLDDAGSGAGTWRETSPASTPSKSPRICPATTRLPPIPRLPSDHDARLLHGRPQLREDGRLEETAGAQGAKRPSTCEWRQLPWRQPKWRTLK